MKEGRSEVDSQFAFLSTVCCLTIVLLGAFCPCDALGADQVSARALQAAVCRVTNDCSGASNIGSGTLIDKTQDGQEGLVLTCAHLFREGAGKVAVRFANGRIHQATLIDIDRQADLAALAIAYPRAEPTEIVLETSKPVEASRVWIWATRNLPLCCWFSRGAGRERRADESAD